MMRNTSLSKCLKALPILAACCAVGVSGAQERDYQLASATPPGAEERGRLLAAADCEQHSSIFHEGAVLLDRQAAMDREVLVYQALVEEALTMRAAAIRLVHELREKLDRGEALSGQDLKLLNQGATDLLEQRAALFRMSQSHECWLERPFPSAPEEARLRRTGVAMSLSAALVLYDNYLLAISLYRNDPKLRRHLNQADKGYALRGNELNRLAASFAAPENRQRVRRGLEWFERHGQASEGDDDGYRYLTQLIEQSTSRNMVRQARPVAFLGNMLNFFGLLTFDTLSSLKNEGLNVSSLLFGNAVGLVESRRGKLDGSAQVLSQLKGRIQAGDILLEKTPFRLTDTFIPGHWGHVAVWVGTEEELRELGIWDHPVVRPYQARIRSGRGVVEALRSGVEMNSLKHFINVDDLAVLHQPGLDRATRTEVVLQSLRQVGKAYDFNFDVESTDRIVCSELVYHAYTHIQWPTVRRLGRVTISPDNVAVQATGAGPFEVALLYHDGRPMGTSGLEMAQLVDGKVVQLANR